MGRALAEELVRRSDVPFASSPAVRARMQKLARRDTSPELRLRQALHAAGMRYFVHRRPLPGLRRQADLVFPRKKVAVFVDGCFWHGCEEHGRRNHRTNGWYWPDKIQSNVQRDRDTDLKLLAAGWAVVRIWEHEDPQVACDRIRAVVAVRSFSD